MVISHKITAKALVAACLTLFCSSVFAQSPDSLTVPSLQGLEAVLGRGFQPPASSAASVQPAPALVIKKSRATNQVATPACTKKNEECDTSDDCCTDQGFVCSKDPSRPNEKGFCD